jgi:Spy/CpxP family protein refolding chaperone
MIRVRLAVTASLALLMVAGVLMGQDGKSAQDDATPPPTKAKGVLPKYFKSLGLTDDQRQKVVKVHAAYAAKLANLKEQMEQVASEERAELNKVLSDTQRVRLRELILKEPDASKDVTAKEEKKSDKVDAKKDEKK